MDFQVYSFVGLYLLLLRAHVFVSKSIKRHEEYVHSNDNLLDNLRVLDTCHRKPEKARVLKKYLPSYIAIDEYGISKRNIKLRVRAIEKTMTLIRRNLRKDKSFELKEATCENII